ncbi:MAG: LysR family transcriptional regulator [Pseudomonadota bacterium]
MRLSTSKELVVFETVARLRSITLAADELVVSKQTVSDQLRRLEDTVGVRLLQRTSRSMSLTEAGTRLYPHCIRVADATKAALQELEEESQEPSGLLTLASSRTFGAHFLAELAMRYLETYPKVQVDLRLEDRRFKIIEEGIDLAFLAFQPEGNDLMCRALFPAEACFVAAPDLLKKAELDEAEDAYGQLPRIEWRQGADSSQTELRATRLRVSSVEIALLAAVRGLGVVKAPRPLAQPHIDAGELTVLPDQEASPTSKIYAVFPSRFHVPSKVRAFLNLVQTSNSSIDQMMADRTLP